MSEMDRRDFLKIAGVGTGAVVFSCYISPDGAMAAQSVTDVLKQGISLTDPNKFVYLDPLHGTVTIWAHRSEMGQGIKSSLAAILADEMEADWSRVVVKQADADPDAFGVPFPFTDKLPKEVPLDQSEPPVVRGEDAQFADSSRSMAAYFDAFRIFGAGIRLALVRAGARHFGVDESQVKASQHKVWHGNRSLDYGDALLLFNLNKLKQENKLPTTDDSVAYRKKPSEWRYIGKQMPFIDAEDMVNGNAVYGADVDPSGFGRPKMLTAMIVRCPVANGSLKSFDATEAMKVPGVKHVVRVTPEGTPAGGVGAAFYPHDGVAVIAENTWAAWQGRRALVDHVKWDLGPNASYDSAAFRAELESSVKNPGKVMRNKGDVDAAFGSAAKTVEAAYHIPHLAQTPMEPPVAVSVYNNGTWDIWAPSQGPELLQHYVGVALLEPNLVKQLVWNVETRDAFTTAQVEAGDWDRQKAFNESLAQALGVDVNKLPDMRDDLKKRVRSSVHVHVPLLGGGFGRKSKPDFAMEAAFLARQFPGVPIRVQWTREDDVKFSYYNAAAGQYWKAALDGDGRPTAVLWRGAATSFFGTLFPGAPAPAVFQKAREAFHNGGTTGYLSAIERAHGFEDMPYDVPNIRIENCVANNHIRTGWMRSVANIYHAFASGSFADEMAVAAGRDSKDYLLDLIGKGHRFTQKELAAQGVKAFDNNLFPVEKRVFVYNGKPLQVIPPYPPDTRRLRAVVERVARESRWDEKVRAYKNMKGRGIGIAAHRAFLSYVAIVADVTLNEKNELTVNEIYGVIDCGRAVNPDRVAAQMEGGIVYGLSYALLGEITCKNGAVEQNNFDDYPVARMYQIPKKIYTYVEDPSAAIASEYEGNEVPPTGVGEPPTPAVAPAIANAIVAAGGPRIREIPFLRQVTVL